MNPLSEQKFPAALEHKVAQLLFKNSAPGVYNFTNLLFMEQTVMNQLQQNLGLWLQACDFSYFC